MTCERVVDSADQLGFALHRVAYVVAAGDRRVDRPKRRKPGPIEDGRGSILHRGIELLRFDLAHRVGGSVVARELDAIGKPGGKVFLRGGSSEHTDPALAERAGALEIGPRSDVPVG